MQEVTKLLHALQSAPAVLVTVLATRGSVPRDAGAWMAVFDKHLVATVGGGRLEQDAIAHARRMLREPGGAVQVHTYPLGPTLGQCCGGEVTLQFEGVGPQDLPALSTRLAPAYTPVALFGGGHVGQALVRVLGLLPVDVRWFDSRDEVFPALLPVNVHAEHSEPIEAGVPGLPPGSRVWVMSFSHAEDFNVVAACLQRQRHQGDLPYVGLIGSKTKWASFRQRLMARGFTDAELAHITCPIGVPGIDDKRPEVIAVAAAAQLLQVGI
ncbi:MAG: xanthine dehydrogenase accessory protein XdhC [Burkholderiales bacterium PBB4]|nr:MAG: xanthine dehydrogenase accessory protein XdhC [Burkholderiales bacterium PBB4]